MKISLPDGSVKEFDQGATGFDVAMSISEGLAKAAVAVKVNGERQDLHLPIDDLQRGREQALGPGGRLDGELDVWPGVGDSTHHVERKDGHHRPVGRVGHAGQPHFVRHPHYTKGAGQAPDVADVRLHDVYTPSLDEPPKAGHRRLLLPGGDGDLNRPG